MLSLCLALLLPAPADLNAARELHTARRYAEAQELAEALVADQPDNADLHQLLGQLARQRRDFPAAVHFLARAVELAPDNAAMLHDYGAACGLLANRSGRTLRAAALARRSRLALARAVELDPTHLGYREALIEFYASAPVFVGGGMPRAYAEVEALRALDARAGVFAHANVLERDQRPGDLLALWQEQREQHPADYEILYRYGLATLAVGDQREEGIAALHRCLELCPPPRVPGHAWVHAALAQLHAARADWPGARAAYTAALALDGRPTIWREALAALPPD